MSKKKKIFDMGRAQPPPDIPPMDQDLINLLNNALMDILRQPSLQQPFLYPGGANYTATQQQQNQLPDFDFHVSPFPPYTRCILDEEARFERDWRSQMPRNWKGWSQGDINKQTAKVWLDEGKGVLCARFPYKQSAIDEFREKIPRGKKSWNAEDKLWEFSVETIDVVVEILARNFDEVIDLTQATTPSQVVVSGDPFLSLLDKEDIKAIYRVLANKYHPDKQGGDAGRMARINQIFSQIK